MTQKKTKTEAQGNATGVPEGYKSLSRTLPPFLTLRIGDSMNGLLQNVRTRTRIQGKGKKKQTVEDFYYEFKLIAAANGEDGTKQHKPVSFNEGDVVTVSGSGAIDRAMLRAAMVVQGVEVDVVKEDNWPDPKWPGVYGFSFFLKRSEDGTMRKGEFAGKMVKQYEIGYKPAQEPVAA